MRSRAGAIPAKNLPVAKPCTFLYRFLTEDVPIDPKENIQPKNIIS